MITFCTCCIPCSSFLLQPLYLHSLDQNDAFSTEEIIVVPVHSANCIAENVKHPARLMLAIPGQAHVPAHGPAPCGLLAYSSSTALLAVFTPLAHGSAATYIWSEVVVWSSWTVPVTCWCQRDFCSSFPFQTWRVLGARSGCLPYPLSLWIRRKATHQKKKKWIVLC